MTNTNTAPDIHEFNAALARFLAGAQSIVTTHYLFTYPRLSVPQLLIERAASGTSAS